MQRKLNTLTGLGWVLLTVGVTLYIFPFFYQYVGSYSGLIAFALIFAGISLLKYRKDQMK